MEKARKKRGVRDGTGPYEGSYQRRVLRRKKGKRRSAGGSCPAVSRYKKGEQEQNLEKIAPAVGRLLSRGAKVGRTHRRKFITAGKKRAKKIVTRVGLPVGAGYVLGRKHGRREVLARDVGGGEMQDLEKLYGKLAGKTVLAAIKAGKLRGKKAKEALKRLRSAKLLKPGKAVGRSIRRHPFAAGAYGGYVAGVGLKTSDVKRRKRMKAGVPTLAQRMKTSRETPIEVKIAAARRKQKELARKSEGSIDLRKVDGLKDFVGSMQQEGVEFKKKV